MSVETSTRFTVSPAVRYQFLRTTAGAINPTLLADIADDIVHVGDVITTDAYYQGYDYGGATYDVVPGGSATEDGGKAVTVGALQLLAQFGSRCSVRQFGARDGVDATSQIQAFLNFTHDNICDQAELEGDYLVSAPITWGSNGGGVSKSQAFSGHVTLRATTAIDIMLDITDLVNLRHLGDIEVLGYTTSNLYSGRTCRVGIRISGCKGSVWGTLSASGFKQDGVQITSKTSGNNNMTTINTIYGTSNGSGAPLVDSLTANWSSPTNTGTSGSVGQITAITVDVDNPNPDVDHPVFVQIGGELYFVRGSDPGELRIFPWLDPANGTSGTLKYFFGATLMMIGGDSGVFGISAVDATNCGIAVGSCSLYGPHIGRIMSQFDGIGLVVGRGTTHAYLSGHVNDLYAEGNVYDIIRNSTYPEQGVEVSGTNILASKCFDLTRPRGAGSALISGGPGFQNGFVVNFGHGPMVGVKSNENAVPGTITVNVMKEHPEQDHVVYRTNLASINLECRYIDHNRLFGFDHRMLTFIGTGANGAPNGTFTFNVPNVTPNGIWTLNGDSSPISFTGFSEPPTFLIFARVLAKDVVVYPISRPLSGATAARPANVPTGTAFYDTTLGSPVWWNGSAWAGASAYVPASGTTAARPASPTTGFVYFDTTLGYPIWYTGSGWIDANGTSV